VTVTLFDELRVENVKGGTALDIADAIVSWDLELTLTQEVPTLKLTIADARGLMHSRALDANRNERLDARLQLRFGGVLWQLAAVEPEGDTIVLVFEDDAAVRLRRVTRRRKWSRGSTTRAEVVRAGVLEAAGPPIPFRSHQLHKVQPVAKGESVHERRQRERDRAQNRQPGLSTADNLTVKGNPAKAAQLDLGERALAQCERRNAGPKATLATMCMLIVESEVQTGAVVRDKDGTSRGPAQITNPTLAALRARGWKGDREDIEDSVDAFLMLGFTGAGGAIKVAKDNPSMTAGQVAQAVQGSANPAEYDKRAAEARKWVAAYDGGVAPAEGDYARKEFFRGNEDGTTQTHLEFSRALAEEVRWAFFIHAGEVWYAPEPDLARARAALHIHHDSEWATVPQGGWDSARDVGEVSVSVNIGNEDPLKLGPGRSVAIGEYGAIDGRYLIERVRTSSGNDWAELQLRLPRRPKKEPAAERVQRASASGSSGSSRRIDTSTARALVASLFLIGKDAGGDGVYVGSAYRPGDPLDHGQDGDPKGTRRAARDIGVKGIDLLVGPPSPKLDKACKAICDALGIPFKEGTVLTNPSDGKPYYNINYKGFRVQVIWRTPQYGGHLGHVHVGARKL
jgi:hypothetical protein